MAAHRGGVHQVVPAALSLTQATECGHGLYARRSRGAGGARPIARLARPHGRGAVRQCGCGLGCHPGDVTWRAGVDILSLGAIKNGGMTAEALVIFDPALVDAIRFRRKRAGQLPSKGRFNAAQLLAYLDGDRWLATAAVANAGARSLAAALGDRIVWPVEANEVFARLRDGEAERLRAAGFVFYDWGDPAERLARFVVAWDTPATAVAALAAALAG